MGYNLSVHSVKRLRPQLEQLLAEQQTLDFPTGNPRSLAYKFREAIKSAKVHDEFAHLADLDSFYSFREIPGAVRAEYLGEPEAYPSGRPAGQLHKNITPERKNFPDVKSLLEVLAVAGKFSGPNSELYFPSIKLSPKEKEKLWNWTQLRDWKYIDHHIGDGEGGITLTRKPVPEEILYSPDKEPTDASPSLDDD